MSATPDRGRACRLILAAAALIACLPPASRAASDALIERRDGYVDAGGVMIYYESLGRGPPLMVLHGGPGVPHGYFLPWFLPLAKTHRLIFIDERGCGRSQRLSNVKEYTLDAMVGDVEAVRRALDLGQTDLLGHSFGGILAQAYAIKHPQNVRRLVVASSGSSAARINADFAKIKGSLDADLRRQIEALEAKGILEKSGAQTPEYRKLADQAEAPYEYFVRPPAWDLASDPVGWDVLSQMWSGRTDFHIDGNLAGFDLTPELRRLRIPTLIIYGDHDLLSPATAKETHAAIADSKLVEVARSGHETFVDQTDFFLRSVSMFLEH